jgi:hypothetical protein
MENLQAIIDRHIAALNNIKLVIEKASMPFKEHAQLQDDLALISKTVAAHLVVPEEKKPEEVLEEKAE